MNIRRIASTLLAANLSAHVLGATAGTSWQSYANTRFDFAGCYPAQLFTPEPEPENQDGRAFTSTDGAVVRMFGRNNVLGESLPDAFQETIQHLKQEHTTHLYAHLARYSFVISGRGKDRIFYEKTIMNDDKFKTLQIEYPAASERKYAPMAARMARCFRSLRAGRP
jgi:hypothetical protein